MKRQIGNIIFWRVMLVAFGIILLMTFSGCVSTVRFSSAVDNAGLPYRLRNSGNQNAGGYPKAGTTVTGIASYYADKFTGLATASGEIYDPSALTAAHRTLPFGSAVQVTNLKNGKRVVVSINDRGPNVSGRIIDLSATAAKQLDMLRDGIVEVELLILSTKRKQP